MKIFAILNNKEKISIKGLNAIIGKQKRGKKLSRNFHRWKIIHYVYSENCPETVAKNLEKRVPLKVKFL